MLRSNLLLHPEADHREIVCRFLAVSPSLDGRRIQVTLIGRSKQVDSIGSDEKSSPESQMISVPGASWAGLAWAHKQRGC